MTDFDPDEPVQTRYGAPARIICRDALGIKPIVALVRRSDSLDLALSYHPDGRLHSYEELPDDLVNRENVDGVEPLVKDSQWYIVYETWIGDAFDSREDVEVFAKNLLGESKDVLRIDWLSDGTIEFTKEPL